jgi:hypothetical protein
MTDPTRRLMAESRIWRSRLAADLAAQGIEPAGVIQQWLLKAIAAQVWAQRCTPDYLPTTGSAIHDTIQQIHALSGLIPAPWLQTEPRPSDRTCRTIVEAIQKQPERLATLADVYGQAPSGQFSKVGGIYYTPWPLVERMVQQTVGQRAIAAPMRIIDPACGCGAFLLMAGRLLWARQRAARPRADGQWLVEQLHGVDVDAAAVAIARLMLWLEWADPTAPADAIALGQSLTTAIRVGNAVLEPNWGQWFPAADSVGGFDGVIGNPPYLDAETMTRYHPQWRQHCATHYATATGNWDVFCVFVEQAIALARVGGWVSLVVPNTLLSANYASAVRSLLGQHRLQWIWDYAQAKAFPAAAVYPVVFLVEKDGTGDQEPLQLVPYQVMRSLTPSSAGDRQEWQLWTGRQNAEWCVVQSLAHAQLWQRIEQQSHPLEAIATVRGAATVSEAYVLADLLQEGPINAELGALDGVAVINSGIIDRYRVQWGKKPLRYLGQVYQRPYVPGDRLDMLSQSRYRQTLSPKLMVAGLTRRLEVAIDGQGRLLAAKSTSIILLDPTARSQCPELPTADLLMLYLLGILNSQLMHRYVQMRFMGNRLNSGYMRIGPPQLRQLPITPWSDRAWPMVQQVQRLLYHYHQPDPCPMMLQSYEQAIDDLVYRQYGLNADEMDALSQMHH